MSKTNDELQVEALQEELERGMDGIAYLYALWEVGQRGNQIAQERARSILLEAIEERRMNQQSEPTIEQENYGQLFYTE